MIQVEVLDCRGPSVRRLGAAARAGRRLFHGDASAAAALLPGYALVIAVVDMYAAANRDA